MILNVFADVFVLVKFMLTSTQKSTGRFSGLLSVNAILFSILLSLRCTCTCRLQMTRSELWSQRMERSRVFRSGCWRQMELLSSKFWVTGMLTHQDPLLTIFARYFRLVNPLFRHISVLWFPLMAKYEMFLLYKLNMKIKSVRTNLTLHTAISVRFQVSCLSYTDYWFIINISYCCSEC